MRSFVENKIIFITGSGGLLGKTYIDTFLKNGAIVIATELPGARSESIKKQFGSNSKLHYYDLDVSKENEVEKIFKKIQNDGLNPNVILNNAAVTGELLMKNGENFPDFNNTTLESWEKTLKVNLTGAFLIARQMDRDIVGKYPAQLINISSMYALNAPHHSIYEGMPFKSFSAYSASKAGIHGLTLWLSSYWASRNCTVNTLAPGAVFNKHNKIFEEKVSNLIMSGRMAEPEEIADVMLFLSSEKARYMTGQIINVDGGFSSW